jgi:hypothetical protein
MLGWEIFIFRVTTQLPLIRSSDLTRHNFNPEYKGWTKCVATWTTGMGGTNWLKKLITQGKAEDMGGNGYPDRYRANAEVIATMLQSGPPRHTGPMVIGDDYATPPGLLKDIRINHFELDKCTPDEILIIEVWDQS